MLPSALRTAFRSLQRRPGFTAINVLGLAVGMACCLLIGLYVQNELSYDRFHAHSDRIYRIVQYDAADERGIGWVGDGMQDVLRGVPQVEASARFTPLSDGTLGLHNDTSGTRTVFEEPGLLYATPEALTVFDLPLLSGNPETALSKPNTIVLTAPLARKYFGASDPMGQTLRLNGAHDLTVTGVAEAPPPNTHLQFDALLSRATYFTTRGRSATYESSSFWWPQTWTFVQLAPGADVAAVQQQIEAATNTRRSEPIAAEFDMVLQPLERIHLHSSEIRGTLSAVGSLAQVWTFGTIAVFILLIAGVNFMNLSTARAEERAREVGVRKAVGAARGQLVRQFLGESLLLSAGSIVLALCLTRTVLPAFSALLGVELAFGVFTNPTLLAGAVLVALFTGMGAGSYPAFVLSRFLPSRVLRGTHSRGSKGSARLRKGLVVVQFAISIVLIVATFTAYQQLRYMQTADLGFDEEQVVAIEARGAYETLKAELQRAASVQAVSGASIRPGIGRASNILNYEFKDVEPPEDDDTLAYQLVDVGYFEMMSIEVLAGRTFRADRRSDLGTVYGPDATHTGRWWRGRAMVINRAAADELGVSPDAALGHDLRVYQQENGRLYNDVGGTIVGVVDDFHTGSLRTEIPPTVFVPAKLPLDVEDQRAAYWSDYLLAKVAPGNAATVMEEMRAVWTDVNPEAPFDASFLDASLNRLYQQEERIGRLIALFSGLAILIACLGLFGLATYAAQRRRKEIGIRKAVGASAASIVRLLSTDFVRLVLVAVGVAAPVAYMLVQRWLADFAYRIDLGLAPFAVAAAAALVIALGTVSTQALRAARVDPAKTLRSE